MMLIILFVAILECVYTIIIIRYNDNELNSKTEGQKETTKPDIDIENRIEEFHPAHKYAIEKSMVV